MPYDHCFIAFDFYIRNQSLSGARPRGTGFIGCSLAPLNSFPAFTDYEREHKQCSHRVRPPPPKPRMQAHAQKEGERKVGADRSFSGINTESPALETSCCAELHGREYRHADEGQYGKDEADGACFRLLTVIEP